jgi:hypothetical protein
VKFSGVNVGQLFRYGWFQFVKIIERYDSGRKTVVNALCYDGPGECPYFDLFRDESEMDADEVLCK